MASTSTTSKWLSTTTCPHEAEDYVHRVGRTARANADGKAVTFVSERDQRRWAQIEKFLEIEVRREEVPAEFGSAPEYKGEAAAATATDATAAKAQAVGTPKTSTAAAKTVAAETTESQGKDCQRTIARKTQSPEVRKDKGKKTSARRHHKKKSTAQAPKIENKD